MQLDDSQQQQCLAQCKPGCLALQVLGIEQFNVAHSMGSSHGLSRIIRLAYHEEPAYVPLLKRAYDLWRELEQDTNKVQGVLSVPMQGALSTKHFERQGSQCCLLLISRRCMQDLLTITGSIDTNKRDAEGYNGFERSLNSAKEHGLEHEVLTGDEVNARFPGYNLPSDFAVSYSCWPVCGSLSVVSHVFALLQLLHIFASAAICDAKLISSLHALYF